MTVEAGIVLPTRPPDRTSGSDIARYCGRTWYASTNEPSFIHVRRTGNYQRLWSEIPEPAETQAVRIESIAALGAMGMQSRWNALGVRTHIAPEPNPFYTNISLQAPSGRTFIEHWNNSQDVSIFPGIEGFRVARSEGNFPLEKLIRGLAEGIVYVCDQEETVGQRSFAMHDITTHELAAEALALMAERVKQKAQYACSLPPSTERNQVWRDLGSYYEILFRPESVMKCLNGTDGERHIWNSFLTLNPRTTDAIFEQTAQYIQAAQVGAVTGNIALTQST